MVISSIIFAIIASNFRYFNWGRHRLHESHEKYNLVAIQLIIRDS